MRCRSGRDAFAARVLLAGAAQRSLDVQYYIWHGDHTGYLLFEALWQAAERGVRVRLLLDDNNTSGLDETIAALDAHPNIEVRLYNPLMRRSCALDELRHRLQPRESPHAQQVAHGRQPGHGRRRPQRRRRLLRRRPRGGVRRPRRDRQSGRPCTRCPRPSTCTGTAHRPIPPRSSLAPATPAAVEQLKATFAATRADPESAQYLESLRETPLVHGAGRRPACRSSGPTRSSCTTIRRRPSTPSTAPTSC